MLLRILSLDTKRHQSQASILSDIANSFPRCPRGTCGRPVAPALAPCLLQTVVGRFRPSAELTQLDGGSELLTRRPPSARSAPITARPDLERPRHWPSPTSVCVAHRRGGGEQLESYCQLSANEKQGSGGISQHRSVIGPEFYYGEFRGGGGGCHMVQWDPNPL